MKLYNPKNGAQFDTESDDEWHNQVYLDMGWAEAPEPEPVRPGYEPEPVVYEPVKPAVKKTSRKSESTDD